jgi:hypothetical protein
MVTAYALLRLPYGAPPGEYEVFLRVFDERARPSGYDMMDGEGRITGTELPLGVWQVEPGGDWSQVSRETDLPYRVDLRLADGSTLLAHNIDPNLTVVPGQHIPIALLWQGWHDRLPILRYVHFQGAAQTIMARSGPRDPITLDWRTVVVAINAAGGSTTLSLEDGTLLATHIIDAPVYLLEPPEVDVIIDQSLEGVGYLYGFLIGDTTADRTQDFPVTLVWEAGYSDVRSDYTVFVQLIDSQGRLIAQSDSQPAGGDRPTTEWRAAEYVIDLHYLKFNEIAAPGEAQLIAGMYNPQTGDRIPIAPNGPEFIELPGTITVR